MNLNITLLILHFLWTKKTLLQKDRKSRSIFRSTRAEACSVGHNREQWKSWPGWGLSKLPSKQMGFVFSVYYSLIHFPWCQGVIHFFLLSTDLIIKLHRKKDIKRKIFVFLFISNSRLIPRSPGLCSWQNRKYFKNGGL